MERPGQKARFRTAVRSPRGGVDAWRAIALCVALVSIVGLVSLGPAEASHRPNHQRGDASTTTTSSPTTTTSTTTTTPSSTKTPTALSAYDNEDVIVCDQYQNCWYEPSARKPGASLYAENKPLAHKPVIFTVHSPRGWWFGPPHPSHGHVICTKDTDERGWATCSDAEWALARLFQTGSGSWNYKAEFLEDDRYQGSSDLASLH